MYLWPGSEYFGQNGRGDCDAEGVGAEREYDAEEKLLLRDAGNVITPVVGAVGGAVAGFAGTAPAPTAAKIHIGETREITID